VTDARFKDRGLQKQQCASSDIRADDRRSPLSLFGTSPTLAPFPVSALLFQDWYPPLRSASKHNSPQRPTVTTSDCEDIAGMQIDTSWPAAFAHNLDATAAELAFVLRNKVTTFRKTHLKTQKSRYI